MIATAISSAMQRFGPRGCAKLMAQEFGDHPDAAAPADALGAPARRPARGTTPARVRHRAASTVPAARPVAKPHPT